MRIGLALALVMTIPLSSDAGWKKRMGGYGTSPFLIRTAPPATSPGPAAVGLDPSAPVGSESAAERGPAEAYYFYATPRLTFFYPEATLRPRSERQEIKEIVAEVMKETDDQKDPLDRIADDVNEITQAVKRIAATIEQMKND